MEDAFAKTLAQAASKKAQIYPAKLIEEQRLATVYGAAITHFFGRRWSNIYWQRKRPV
jgi:hypothetical protein